MPFGKVLAVAVRLAVTEAAAPPGVRVPPDGDTLSQALVLTRLQVRVLVPALVKVSDCDAGVKGPPTGPLKVNPVTGLIRRSSGRSKDSCTPVVVELVGEVAL